MPIEFYTQPPNPTVLTVPEKIKHIETSGGLISLIVQGDVTHVHIKGNVTHLTVEGSVGNYEVHYKKDDLDDV